MNNTVSITLSKETKQLQAACRELITERDKLKSKSADVLADDKAALDKASETLANLMARESVVNARLPRRRTELYAALCKDLTAMFAAAEAEMFRARDALRQAKVEYREKVLAECGKSAAEKLLTDPGVLPKSVTRCQTDLDQARKLLAETGALRSKIDKAYAEIGAETRAAHPSGKSYIQPVEYYYANAKPFVPELADELPKANDPPWMIRI